eukprot:scaffold43811_cov62-Phaeocystis_antarctica.AAC.6
MQRARAQLPAQPRLGHVGPKSASDRLVNYVVVLVFGGRLARRIRLNRAHRKLPLPSESDKREVVQPLECQGDVGLFSPRTLIVRRLVQASERVLLLPCQHTRHRPRCLHRILLEGHAGICEVMPARDEAAVWLAKHGKHPPTEVLPVP